MLNRNEKENKVIELYKQGKNYRKIAQQVHMSFGDIGKTIREFTGESFKEKTISKDTQAIKLFSHGKTPIDAVIELDIGADVVNRVYRDYLKLKRLYQLCAVYEEIKNDIPSFIKLFRLLKEKGIAEKNVLELFQYSDQIPLLKILFDSLHKKIKKLSSQNDIISAEYYDLQSKLGQSQKLLQQYQSELGELIRKINVKYSYLKTTESSIEDLLNDDDGYLKIKKIVEEKVSEILDNKKNLLMASVIAALLAIRRDKDKGILIDYLGYYNNEVGYAILNNNSPKNSLSNIIFKHFINRYLK